MPPCRISRQSISTCAPCVRPNTAQRSVASTPSNRAARMPAVSAAHHSTDQTAHAIPPAQSDTNPPACQRRDNESAPQSHTQSRATLAPQPLEPPPTPPTRPPPPNTQKKFKNHRERSNNPPPRVKTPTLSGKPSRRSSPTRATNVSPCSGANRNAVPPVSSARINRTARWHKPQCPS